MDNEPCLIILSVHRRPKKVPSSAQNQRSTVQQPSSTSTSASASAEQAGGKNDKIDLSSGSTMTVPSTSPSTEKRRTETLKEQQQHNVHSSPLKRAEWEDLEPSAAVRASLSFVPARVKPSGAKTSTQAKPKAPDAPYVSPLCCLPPIATVILC